MHDAPVDPGCFAAIADWLGDSLDTVVPLHALRTRRCAVWLDGAPAAPRAVLLLADYVKGEPWALGTDAASAARLLDAVPGWSCVNVSLDLANAMADALSRATGRPVTRYGDLYFAPARPVEPPTDQRVRLMTRDDAALLRAAPDDARPGEDAFIDVLLREGFCAAATVDGHVVAQAHAYGITPRHAEIGARTAAAYRCRGLSTACGAALSHRLQATGRLPVWSTGEANVASQRVAAKIGLELVHRRVYLSTSPRAATLTS
jgi:RimJ/RimL family protein N-acetyltransferase